MSKQFRKIVVIQQTPGRTHFTPFPLSKHSLILVPRLSHQETFLIACFFPLPSQVLVVQPTSPSVQIKEPPPSPGSPSAENMYAAPGPLYVQVRPRPHTRNNNKKHTRAYRKDSPINHFSNRRRCDYFACFCPSLRRANNANDLRAPNNSRIGGHHKACCRSNLTPTIEI